jgi:DNA-binding transcriptional LysR family regulator
MSLSAWRTFVTVCRLGSLSAAADELGYTQSAVSRQVAGLERQVGVPLVERHARGIRPTAAGEAFRHHAQAAVNAADRAVRAAREARDGSPARPLAVGATPSLAASVVPAAMRRLLDEAGPLPWDLVPGLTGDLHERTVSGELDIAIVTDAPPGLPGKVALVATGHAVALVPGVLATALRADVTTLALVNPPTRGIYAVLPHHDPHPAAPLLVRQVMTSFR